MAAAQRLRHPFHCQARLEHHVDYALEQMAGLELNATPFRGHMLRALRQIKKCTATMDLVSASE